MILALSYYPGIFKERLRETMEKLSQDSWPLSQDLIWDLPDKQQKWYPLECCVWSYTYRVYCIAYSKTL
jgi:hypothetical protein